MKVHVIDLEKNVIAIFDNAFKISSVEDGFILSYKTDKGENDTIFYGKVRLEIVDETIKI
jgi:hypothetical protein